MKSTEKVLPKRFLRGISNEDFIENGYVTQSAFQFAQSDRCDDMLELSISWFDDADAVSVLLKQKKANGKSQFSAGIAVLELQQVKNILRHFLISTFSYERMPTTYNKYHGNLLVSKDTNKQTKTLISCGLALVAGTNIIREYD